MPNEPNGKKFDTGKPQISLLPWKQVIGVVRVLEFGAKKYAVDNWKHVPDAERRYLDAAMRHLGSLMEGEKVDPETGMSHWYHAACCCLFGGFFGDKPVVQEVTTTKPHKCPLCGTTSSDWLELGANGLVCRNCGEGQ